MSDGWLAFEQGLQRFYRGGAGTNSGEKGRFQWGNHAFNWVARGAFDDGWGWLSVPYPSAAGVGGGGYRSPPRVEVAAPRPMGLSLRPAKESSFISATDLAEDRRVGVPEFDRNVYIQSGPDEPTVQAVLADARVQRATLSLFSLGCAVLVIDDSEGLIKARLEAREMPANDNIADAILDALATLVSGLPQIIPA